jgi:hypothetical protein
MTTQLTTFVKEFLAIIKGDDAEAKAQKAYRSAMSALKTQISSLEGDTIKFEDEVEEAESKFNLAKVNSGEPIVDRNKYVQNLLVARRQLIDAEEALENHLEKIEVLRSTFEEIQETA